MNVFRFSTFTYTERDVALYALGVGTGGADPCNPSELPFVYHPDGQSSIKVLPTFTVLYPFKFVESMRDVPGLHYDPNLLLHGEQYIEIYQPIPTKATIDTKQTTNIRSSRQRNTIFLRGAGGFSIPGKPYSFLNRTDSSVSSGVGSSTSTKKDLSGGRRSPHHVFEDRTQPSQALLYRLSGDYNPLHSDPSYAKMAGSLDPLHGLCTPGYATRAVIACLCEGEPSMVQSVQGRFLLHVFPGETLIIEMKVKTGWTTNSRSENATKLSSPVVFPCGRHCHDYERLH